MLRKALTRSGLTLLVMSATMPARANAPAPCFDAFARGQRLLTTAKLLAARSSFSECVNDSTCPAPPLLKDCAEQLEGVGKRIPSIVVTADNAPPSTKVFIDGEATPRDLDGRAIELDPGAHDIEARSPAGARVSQRVLVAEGRKLEPVALAFPVTMTAPSSLPSATDHPSHTASWVLGGIGIASLGGFGVLAGVGQASYDGCVAQGCTSSAVDALTAERVVAWTALGVGVVTLTFAAVLFFVHRGHAAHVARAWPLAF